MPTNNPEEAAHAEARADLHPIAPTAVPEPPERRFTPPTPGEAITSSGTGNTYTMGDPLGEGSFGVVFQCTDGWNNQLAAKVLKPYRTYEEVKAAAEGEVVKLFHLRHPFITYVHDFFEYRDTFYIITERCDQSLAQLLAEPWFTGPVWLMAFARCLLQAAHFIHTAGFAHQDIHIGNVFAAHVR